MSSKSSHSKNKNRENTQKNLSDFELVGWLKELEEIQKKLEFQIHAPHTSLLCLTFTIKAKPDTRISGKTPAISLRQGKLLVAVQAPAVDGKANEAILEAMADFFGLAKSRLSLIKGQQGKEKVIALEIEERQRTLIPSLIRILKAL